MSLGDWAENAVADWLLGGSSPTRPSTRYVSLHTADPGETGTGEHVGGTDLGYARQVITFGAASGGVASNSNAPSWTSTDTDNWAQSTHFAVWDAITAGNLIGTGSLTTPRTLGPGDSATFSAGALTVTIT
jgi:hypothetical protein